MDGIIIFPLLLLAGIVFAILAVIAPEQVKPQHRPRKHFNADNVPSSMTMAGEKWYFTRDSDDM
jgi:hypothetical protein